MNFRKRLYLLLWCILAAALTACGSAPNQTTTKTATASTVYTQSQVDLDDNSSSGMSITPNSASIAPGTQITLVASGGSGNYSYTIHSSTVSGGTIGTSSGVFSAPGSTGTVTIKATDAAGNVAYATISISGSGNSAVQGITRTFYNPGTSSFTVPSGVNRLYVSVQGGGGGAAVNQCTSPSVQCFYGAGGGGAGGFAQGWVSVTAGATYTVQVGRGGTVGAVGGTSSFNGGAIYATGGNPGASFETGSDQGGTGGQGYNGSYLNYAGNPGGNGTTGSKGITSHGAGGVGVNGYGAGHAGGAISNAANLSGQGGFVVIYY